MTTAKRKPQKSPHARPAKTARSVRKVAPAKPRYSELYERALKERDEARQLCVGMMNWLQFEVEHLSEEAASRSENLAENCKDARERHPWLASPEAT